MFQKDKCPVVLTIKALRPLIFPIEVFTRIDDQKYSLVLVFLCGGIYLFLENIKVCEVVWHTSVLYTGTNVEEISPKLTAEEFSHDSYFGALRAVFLFFTRVFQTLNLRQEFTYALESSYLNTTHELSTLCTCTRQYARTKERNIHYLNNETPAKQRWC